MHFLLFSAHFSVQNSTFAMKIKKNDYEFFHRSIIHTYLPVTTQVFGNVTLNPIGCYYESRMKEN